MSTNLIQQELVSTTTLQKNLFKQFRELQNNKSDKLIGVLSNNKIVGFLTNKKFIDDYFEMKARQKVLEELVDDLQDAIILKESIKDLKKDDLVSAKDIYQKLKI